jgi:hypothetical protein
MQQILPKTAQICPNLFKIGNFEIPPKIEIFVFSETKISMHRGGTRACLHRSDFQSKNFSYTIFIVEKNGLCT